LGLLSLVMAFIEYGGLIQLLVSLGRIYRLEISKMSPEINNINVNQSVVGSINTGNIGQIDVALTNIKNGGAEGTAEIIKEFTEAVLAEEELNADIKNEVIEQIAFLANQAALPKEGQKKSIIGPILNTIGKGVQCIPKLLMLFEALKGIFR